MSERQVAIIVADKDGNRIVGATVATYQVVNVQQTGPDGVVHVPLDDSVTDVSIKVQGVPNYEFYLQGQNLLLPARNVNVGIGVPVGPTDVQLPPLVPSQPPVTLREWRANMCGIRVPGLPPVPGGASDASLFLSWFYHLYGPSDRAVIRAAMKARPSKMTHWLLSWSDARRAGLSAADLVALAQELMAAGFAPAIMLTGKYDTSDWTVQQILDNALAVLPVFIAGGIKIYSVGWELNSWLSPAELRQYIDAMAPVVVGAECLLYVHFTAGVFAWQADGHDTASFWNACVGQLTGILYQKGLEWDDALFQAIIQDGLSRFSGNFNFVTDSGFGHPFDYVTLEDTAELQFDGSCSEEEGDRVGAVGMATASITGPTGVTVGVMGFGNGCTA